MEEIEKKLRASSNDFVPDCLTQIKRACDKTQIERPKPRKTVKVFAALGYACVAILLVFGAFFGITYNQEYEKIVLELNPSVEFTINQYERVIDVEFLNNDGEELFENLVLKNKKLDEVLEIFVVQAKQKGYFDNAENEVQITLISEKNNSSERLDVLQQKMQECMQKNQVANRVGSKNISEQDMQEIENSNLSPAKYALIQEIVSLDSSYTIDSLSQKTMSELRVILRNLK